MTAAAADRAGEAEDARFWMRRFVSGWYRGAAHLDNDLSRFAKAYRIAPPARLRLRAALRTLEGVDPAA